MTYERKFGRWLKRLQLDPVASQWIAFCDANGLGYAQPDYFILRPQAVILFECKLTQREEAFAQLNGLYRPLLKFLYNRPVVACQVTRNLRWHPGESLIEDPFSIVGTSEEKTWTMHWLG